ncbi:peptide maturation system acyl carrier-related protein [Paenibacillus sp. FSL L8-0470]|uniref:peptide maturation system acyl carrier-related protein n=1 Tax=unclassified Paenibacillus TaxID=185978 RepID=UPI0030F7E598
MDLDQVREQMNEILFGVMGMDKNKLNENYFYEDLLGGTMQFSPRDLLVLFVHIEETLKIQIPETDILNGCFHSLDRIYHTVCRIIQEKRIKELV